MRCLRGQLPVGVGDAWDQISLKVSDQVNLVCYGQSYLYARPPIEPLASSVNFARLSI